MHHQSGAQARQVTALAQQHPMMTGGGPKHAKRQAPLLLSAMCVVILQSGQGHACMWVRSGPVMSIGISAHGTRSNHVIQAALHASLHSSGVSDAAAEVFQ